MIAIEEITAENWKNTLKKVEYNDIETIEYLKEHEEEILDTFLENSSNITLEEKRKLYVKTMIDRNVEEEDFDKVYEKIENIRQNQNSCILQFGKRLPGSSNTVFEFGNKIIKFGKPFTIINDPNILQPEFEMDLENGYRCMTGFERTPIVYTVDDKEIAQEMYNRIRDAGLVWFDAIGYNVGKIENVTDENDDGLRIIDAQYMEYERDIFMRIQPETNEKYRNNGIGAYGVALRDYIIDHGYGAFEKRYEEMLENRRNNANKKDLEVVAERSSMSGLQKVKEFLSNLFHRKGKIDKDER